VRGWHLKGERNGKEEMIALDYLNGKEARDFCSRPFFRAFPFSESDIQEKRRCRITIELL
jgi:hypothetical protein